MSPKSILILSLLALAGLLAALHWLPTQHNAPPSSTATVAERSLLVYCAVSIRKPAEAAAQQYERDYGVRVQLQFGGSQTLLTNAKISHTGDLYIPADHSYIAIARKDDLIIDVMPLATMRPVLAVKKGNPHNIHTLADLARDDVRLGIADPKAAAIGHVVQETLSATHQWDTIATHVIVTKATVNDIATDVRIGTIDTAFVWDVTVKQMAGELEIVNISELENHLTTVPVTLLKSAPDASSARRFMRYLSSSDLGAPLFEKAGFGSSGAGVLFDGSRRD